MMLRRFLGVSLLSALSQPRAVARYLPGRSLSLYVNFHRSRPSATKRIERRQFMNGLSRNRFDRRRKRQFRSVPFTRASETSTRWTPLTHGGRRSRDLPFRCTPLSSIVRPLRVRRVSGGTESTQRGSRGLMPGGIGRSEERGVG